MLMSLQVVLSICLLSILIFILGITGVLNPFICGLLFIFLILATTFLVSRVFTDYFHDGYSDGLRILLAALLFFTICFHLTGVMVPETGFDALWYHLPLVEKYSQSHQLFYDATFYQSLYPQYGDGLLLIGFSVFDVIGAKIVAYIFFLLLIITVYSWIRKTRSAQESLLGTLVVALFQVVSWQASSGYVDVMSAVFFLWSVEYLLSFQKNRSNRLAFYTSALAAGVFFGTKFVNLGFLPLYLVLTCVQFGSEEKLNSSRLQKLARFSIYWLILGLVALPWYIRAWWYTGSLIYPIGTIYAIPVIEQMGVTGWSEWLSIRLRTVWKLPLDFFFRNDGYTTPLILLFTPFLLIRKNWTKPFFLGMMIGIYGLLFWFFFPPPSTRYVLGLVIVLWITIYQATVLSLDNSKYLRNIVYSLIILNVIGFLLIRVFVSTRAVPYLLGWENQEEYLNRFRNGFLDEKIDGFY